MPEQQERIVEKSRKPRSVALVLSQDECNPCSIARAENWMGPEWMVYQTLQDRVGDVTLAYAGSVTHALHRELQ